ncbi:unnamed protein product [Prorocentrum cordatum]|uniref:Uncharacterized protein n=1 Tax=Prorocentrum cordatum TaxID=2364126 RepID=A0ABN9XDJ8_9DINO|nr:unnamed protein product [Polarella glacialis]
MLTAIDSALAGAIDVVADDVSATMKSLKEKGWKGTLSDAVEDAASLVKDTAVGAISRGAGALTGKTAAPAPVSGHSGIQSDYANVLAGQPRFQYDGPGAKPSAPAAQGGSFGGIQRGAGINKPATTAGFGPGIGIQRASPGGYTGPSPGCFTGGTATKQGGVAAGFAAAGAFGSPPNGAMPPMPVPPA